MNKYLLSHGADCNTGNVFGVSHICCNSFHEPLGKLDNNKILEMSKILEMRKILSKYSMPFCLISETIHPR